MNDHGIPVIRLTLEGMRATILRALTEYEALLAEETRKAVDDYCTPENIRSVMARETSQVINAAIREEVERFYRSGLGRRVIRESVEANLQTEAEAWERLRQRPGGRAGHLLVRLLIAERCPNCGYELKGQNG